MARSVIADQSVLSSRRSRRSRYRSSTTSRRHNIKLESVSNQPDIDELRRLRGAYLDRAVQHSLKGNRSAVRPSSTSSNREKSSKSKTPSRRPARRPADRTEEYVYGTAQVDIIHEEEEGSKVEHVRRRRRPSYLTNDRPSIRDDDLTPSDSVSQVASRRHRSRRSLRPTLRSSEESELASKNRRDSLLSSLFSRRTSTTGQASSLVECLTCGADDIPIAKAVKLECDHRMCHSCLKRIFRLAVKDAAHMPPKCCTDKHIPLKYVDGLFDLRFKLTFNRKLDEYKTKNRIYCPNKRCGIWIRPSNYAVSKGRRYAQCSKCKTRACLMCGLKLHKSSDCPKDPEIAKLVEQASEQGWKRCYNCNAMVELKEGCNHMTCRCLAEFCMACGLKWKTCDCAWFNTPAAGNDILDGIRDPFDFIRRHLPALDELQVPAIRLEPQTRAQELAQRRQQENDDADLARRMQFARLWD